MSEILHTYTYIHTCVLCLVTQSCPILCVTSWTVVHQAPLFIGLSRQESWVAIPSPEESSQPQSPTLLESLPSKPLGKRIYVRMYICTCVCIVSHSSQRGEKVKKLREGHRGSRVLRDLKIGKSKMYICVVGDGNDRKDRRECAISAAFGEHE